MTPPCPPLAEADAAGLSPIVLAYVGDSVYELMVRSYLAVRGRVKPDELHRLSVGYVKASAQSESARLIKDRLTADEEAQYRRGRNAKAASRPKGSGTLEYRRSTGFEALMGYLYLTGNTARLSEVFSWIVGADGREGP